MNLAVPVDHKERMKDSQILTSCQRVEKAVEYEVDSNINCDCCTWKSSERLRKETGSNENQRKNQNNSDHSIIKIR